MKHLTIDVPRNKMTIFPVCDVQLGAKGADLDGFARYMARAAKDPNAHIIGVGDYTDGVSPSNRKLLRAAYTKGELYDKCSDMMSRAAREQTDEFNEIVKRTVGKWDVVLTGHHFWTHVIRESDERIVLRPSDADVAKFVGAPYVEEGAAASITYRFPAPAKGAKRPTLTVFTRHGEGHGQSFASPLNALEKHMRAFIAQVYLIGHHHKSVAARAVRLTEAPKAETSLVADEVLLVGDGSFLRGYMQDEVTYAEAGQMIPLATGAPVIKVEVKDGALTYWAEV